MLNCHRKTGARPQSTLCADQTLEAEFDWRDLMFWQTLPARFVTKFYKADSRERHLHGRC